MSIATWECKQTCLQLEGTGSLSSLKRTEEAQEQKDLKQRIEDDMAGASAVWC
jgi:hypothetical protein